jgi:hypothetical protein
LKSYNFRWCPKYNTRFKIVREVYGFVYKNLLILLRFVLGELGTELVLADLDILVYGDFVC